MFLIYTKSKENNNFNKLIATDDEDIYNLILELQRESWISKQKFLVDNMFFNNISDMTKLKKEFEEICHTI